MNFYHATQGFVKPSPAEFEADSWHTLGAAAQNVLAFVARAEARAILWKACELELHEAVDVLQADAEQTGLVAELGKDAVQAILCDAFHRVR